MPKTLVKSRLHSNKHTPKIKEKPNKTQFDLPLHLQTFKKIAIRKWFYCI